MRLPGNEAFWELSLTTLKIHHKTTYHYLQPLILGPNASCFDRVRAAIFA